ncbi:MAG: hypothetical protein JNM93_01495 [Bacteriovoracaceae bacterium]|nr:hypothetical protein [Bacteriovoracaceae bacterium]
MVIKVLLTLALLLNVFNIKKITTQLSTNKIACDSHKDENEPKPEGETENKLETEIEKDILMAEIDFTALSKKLSLSQFDYINIFFSEYLRELPIKPPIA